MERRIACELRLAPPGANQKPRLAGYAAVFDKPSQQLGQFVEYVRPGAFTRSLNDGDDVVALIHHMPSLVLGRRSAGTLRLSEDDHGLAFEVDLPDTTAGRDIAVSVKRKDINGASFAFEVREGGDRWIIEEDKVIRELTDVLLHDVTVTPTPAYPDTSVATRALARHCGHVRLMLATRYLETVR